MSSFFPHSKFGLKPLHYPKHKAYFLKQQEIASDFDDCDAKHYKHTFPKNRNLRIKTK